MADYYVDTVTGDDVTGDGSSGSPWESVVHALSEIGSLTEDTVVHCSGTEDAGHVDISNGNTGGPWDLTIQADEGQSDGLYEGTGFSSSHYYISHTDAIIAVDRGNATSAPLLKNIQTLAKRTGSSRNSVIGRHGSIFDRVRCFNNTTAGNHGLASASGTTTGYWHAIGCYADMTKSLGTGGVGGNGINVGSATAAQTYDVHNNTVVGCINGLVIQGSSAHTFNLYSNLIFDCTSDVTDIHSGTPTYNDGGNAIEDNDDETWMTVGEWININDSDWALATDLEDHTNGDYRPANGGALDGAGDNTSSAVTDIAGVAFTDPPSIGAFEAVASGFIPYPITRRRMTGGMQQ